jgi:hypothetical protein
MKNHFPQVRQSRTQQQQIVAPRQAQHFSHPLM